MKNELILVYEKRTDEHGTHNLWWRTIGAFQNKKYATAYPITIIDRNLIEIKYFDPELDRSKYVVILKTSTEYSERIEKGFSTFKEAVEFAADFYKTHIANSKLEKKLKTMPDFDIVNGEIVEFERITIAL